MPRGKQSGIAYGQKKQNGQSDTEQLIQIASYLRQKYKVKVKREAYLLFNINNKLKSVKEYVTRADLNDHHVKNPDLLWIDKYGMWIAEIDGAVHDRKVEKTNKRNELFRSNGIKLIVVNLADCKELGINIYEYIDKEVLRLIRNE
jgi:very-short-patch-repair endonuclease